MIDISQEISEHFINESKRCNCMFKDDNMTFKQLKNLFNDVFGSNIVSFSRKTPCIQLCITNKDGDFVASNAENPKKTAIASNVASLCKNPSINKEQVCNSTQALVDALNHIDVPLLNRFFANGKNRMKFTLVCRPNVSRSFIQFDDLECLDSNDDVVGADKKAAFELFKILQNDRSLKNEFCEMTPEQLNGMKCCTSEKKILDAALSFLKKLVDGIGWGCSFKYYMHERCSSDIVNNALEHGLDVSKNGCLVDEIASRLCQWHSRPTKSDLMTYAKRDGIDCKGDDFKDFLNSIDAGSDSLSRKTIAPLQKILLYVISKTIDIVLGYLQLSTDPKVKKILNQLAFERIIDDVLNDEYEIDDDCICKLKKLLMKLNNVIDSLPQEIVVMNGGKPYHATFDANRLKQLIDIAI